MAEESGKKKKDKQVPESFEARLKRLEDIVDELEKGEIPLQETIKLFEKGKDLTNTLSTELEDAEKKIEQLVKEADGTLRTEPFDPDQTDEEDRQ